MTNLTINEYWRYTLRSDALAQRRAMADTLHLYALPGILSIAVPAPQSIDFDQDALNTPVLPAHEPTGILS